MTRCGRSCRDLAGRPSRFAAVAVAAAVAVVTMTGCASSASEKSDQITSTVLDDDAALTVLDQTIVYPESGPAAITTAVIEIPPGVETGWHFHEVPLVAYVMEGTLTVTYDTADGETTNVYGAGESVLEAIGTRHNGRNDGDAVVRLFAVYIGADGSADTVTL